MPPATCESDPKPSQTPSLLNQTTFTTDGHPWPGCSHSWLIKISVSIHCPGFTLQRDLVPHFELRRTKPTNGSEKNRPETRLDSRARPIRMIYKSRTGVVRSQGISLDHASGSPTHNGKHTFRGYTLPGFRVPFISRSWSPDSANPPFAPMKEEYKSGDQN